MGLFIRTWIFPISHAIRLSLNEIFPSKFGFIIFLRYASRLVTSLMSLCFLMYSMVFPNTELFMSLKKSFSKLFLALVQSWMLKAIYSTNHVLWSNLIAWWILFKTSPYLSNCSKALMWMMYLSLWRRLGPTFGLHGSSSFCTWMGDHYGGREGWDNRICQCPRGSPYSAS